MKKFTEEDLKIIINKQFEINWYDITFEDIKETEDWFTTYTTTEDKEEEFKKWLRTYYKKYVSTARIEKEIWHFILSYWLKLLWKD